MRTDADRARDTRYAKWRALRQAQGIKLTFDAGPVREHVARLRAAGLSEREIAAASGVPRTTLRRLPTVAIVMRRTALALQAVRPEDASPQFVDAAGSRRRLQALATLGHSLRSLSGHLGLCSAAIHLIQSGKRGRVSASTAATIRQVYDRLWDAPAPTETRGERISATSTRAAAAARQWVPPLAWDDETIDDPAAQPDLGEASPSQVDLEEVEHLRAGGVSDEDIARRMGVQVSAIERAEFRAMARVKASAKASETAADEAVDLWEAS
jgi:hypothetical protein